MPEAKAREIADGADLIVNGYAFAKIGDNVRVVNMRTGKAALFADDGEMIETSMDDLDVSFALKYLRENARFME